MLLLLLVVITWRPPESREGLFCDFSVRHSRLDTVDSSLELVRIAFRILTQSLENKNQRAVWNYAQRKGNVIYRRYFTASVTALQVVHDFSQHTE